MKISGVVLIGALALGIHVAPVAADTQQAAKVYRIGTLLSAASPMREQTFVQALKDLGYVEGQNVVIERRYSEGRFERLPDLAAELVGLNPDVIFVASGYQATAVLHATKTIPSGRTK